MTGVRFRLRGVDLRGSFCLWQLRNFFKDQLNSRGLRDPTSRLRKSRYVETALRSLSTQRTLRAAILQSQQALCPFVSVLGEEARGDQPTQACRQARTQQR